MKLPAPPPAAAAVRADEATARLGGTASATPDSALPFADVMKQAMAALSLSEGPAQAGLRDSGQGQVASDWQSLSQSLQQLRQSVQGMVQLRQQLESAYRAFRAGEGL